MHATECTSCTFCGYEFSLTSKLVTDLLPRHPWRFCIASAFENRREHKLTAGTPKNEHPCSFLGHKFAGANLLLLETTALLGSFDTLRINFFAVTAYRKTFP